MSESQKKISNITLGNQIGRAENVKKRNMMFFRSFFGIFALEKWIFGRNRSISLTFFKKSVKYTSFPTLFKKNVI